jgi:hypothetical protein
MIVLIGELGLAVLKLLSANNLTLVLVLALFHIFSSQSLLFLLVLKFCECYLQEHFPSS